jgi:hypothetical protein
MLKILKRSNISSSIRNEKNISIKKYNYKWYFIKKIIKNQHDYKKISTKY